MHFLVLLYADEATMPEPGTPAFDADLIGFARFGEQAGTAIAAGAIVEPAEDPDPRSVSTGIPTPEALVGFYVLETTDLDRAVALGTLIPVARYGTVEVRPLGQWFDRRSTPTDGRHLVTLHHPGGAPTDRSAPAAETTHQRFAAIADDVVVAGGALHPAESGRSIRRGTGGNDIAPASSDAAAPSGAFYLLDGDDAQVAELMSLLPLAPGATAALHPIVAAEE